MQQPEFVKLLSQYMDEMSSPEAKKEQEEYLKQVEREQSDAKKEGKQISAQIVIPVPVQIAIFFCNIFGIGIVRQSTRGKAQRIQMQCQGIYQFVHIRTY